MTEADDLAARMAADLATVEREIAEIDLLVVQARTEADRHEQKRAAAADRAGPVVEGEGADPQAQLVGLTRRAALMASQVEVLEGKRKTMSRFQNALAGYGAAAGAGAAEPTSGVESDGAADSTGGPGGDRRAVPPELSGLVLGAQEDLRREIARAMHDGPAQSLTNIILQAQIVERLLAIDPTMAAGEVRLLVSMVQQTLEATKSFIFDVRPMVLDDLGLVPTIRRAARERGQRAGLPVTLESMGTDRRLRVDLESTVFRVVDLALVAFLAQAPEQVSIQLDWGDRLEVRVWAIRPPETADPARKVPLPSETAEDVPPALAEMMEDRRRAEREAVETARRATIVALPDATWREIQGRATTAGIVAELMDAGGDLRLIADIPTA